MESDSAFDHNEDSKQRGPTTKAKANKVKLVVSYNKKVSRLEKKPQNCLLLRGWLQEQWFPKPMILGWKLVMKCVFVPIFVPIHICFCPWLWTNSFCMFQEKFVVDPKSRKQTLRSIREKWRKFKHYLYAKFINNLCKDPKANLFKPPKDYPFIEKEDWNVFVSHRVTKKWEEKSTKAKNTRAHHKYHHRLSRKGYARLINDIV
uniref:Uncharacterized protein n=1 Tax=Lactuca sativa TaxID=4236 RepID=A0A9R1VVN9_LACSA|nr:hypothetical protein LSAT_V11C400212550 [Lactuca sativa]